MYRTIFLALARNETFKKLLLACPITRQVVNHFVAGETWDEASDAVAALRDKGLKASVDFLGKEVSTLEGAQATVAAYLSFLDRIGEQGWASDVEVSVKLTSLGLLLRDGEQLAAANAAILAEKARETSTTVTIDMEDITTVAKALKIIKVLRETYPEVGCLLQANLKRTENDCRTMDRPGAGIRLGKGAYKPPLQATYQDKHDVDLSYVRCMKILMEGEGTPLIATHDPVMIEIAQELAAHSNRGIRDFELQMLYGVRTLEQERLVDLGHVVRVYVPFGDNWYPYFIRRIAERPANLGFFFRGLLKLR
ncbi:MAG: proline dehydrogenase family protein [Propionibacteriaceae bacterium]|nr:proline dehydrogenase family protein [Propionibacteriaceae bacterium]